MLDAYIIDAIRREEEERARREEGRRVWLEIPLHRPEIGRDMPREEVERDERPDGPIIIPFNTPDAWEEDAA